MNGGWNPDTQPESIENESLGVDAGPESGNDHGEKIELVPKVPHHACRWPSQSSSPSGLGVKSIALRDARVMSARAPSARTPLWI
jgi:hypothetical protein